ncbi:MAG: NAD(P)-dependent oxidoreductase, partial [Candidatus Acidiferrum sp.]
MSSATSPRKIGLIGLGLMGRPMGMNLLKAGHALTVWNRTAGRADELVAAGARLAKSPREAAEGCEVLFTVVSDPPGLEEVLWGSGAAKDGKRDGALSGLKSGSMYIDCSTVSPALARKIAGACAERGVRFLDAPMTGGDWGAKKGELVFMVGGDEATLKDAEPILRVVGKKWFHLGPNGAGQTIKLAMNLILALQVDALAEALALVTGAGLAGERLVEVMQSSMARAPVLDIKSQNLLKGEFTPSFPLRLMHKDMGLALDLAKQLGLQLPAAAAAYGT